MVEPVPSSAATAPNTPLAIGIEIAESAMRLRVTFDGAPRSRRWQSRLATPPTPDEALAQIEQLIARARADIGADVMPPAALGVAVWGRVDATVGDVRELRRVEGWEGFPLAEHLRQRYEAPVLLASAINAAAQAEARLGAGVGSRALLYVHLGRNVSSAFVRDGVALTGAQGAEGQIGHWRVASTGPRCACGLVGHLDPLASAQSIVRTMIGRASDSDASTAAMLRITGGRAEAMTAPQVVQLATAGEPSAVAVLQDATDALAIALANAVALLDPDYIVIGGPLAESGEAFIGPLRARLEPLCRPFLAPPLRSGALEPFAALLGAHLLASE